MSKVIQVIESDVVRGKGIDADPLRTVKQYWSFDGELLAENDPLSTVPKPLEFRGHLHRRWAVIAVADRGAPPRNGYAYLYKEKPTDTQVSGIGLAAFACIEIQFREGEGLSGPVAEYARENVA